MGSDAKPKKKKKKKKKNAAEPPLTQRARDSLKAKKKSKKKKSSARASALAANLSGLDFSKPPPAREAPAGDPALIEHATAARATVAVQKRKSTKSKKKFNFKDTKKAKLPPSKTPAPKVVVLTPAADVGALMALPPAAPKEEADATQSSQEKKKKKKESRSKSMQAAAETAAADKAKKKSKKKKSTSRSHSLTSELPPVANEVAEDKAVAEEKAMELDVAPKGVVDEVAPPPTTPAASVLPPPPPPAGAPSPPEWNSPPPGEFFYVPLHFTRILLTI